MQNYDADVEGNPAALFEAGQLEFGSGFPRPTTLTMPNIVASSNAGLGAATDMTPTSLNQRLPSIVDSTPQDVSGAACTFSDWVDQNTTLVIVGLAAIGLLVIAKHKGAR